MFSDETAPEEVLQYVNEELVAGYKAMTLSQRENPKRLERMAYEIIEEVDEDIEQILGYPWVINQVSQSGNRMQARALSVNGLYIATRHHAFTTNGETVPPTLQDALSTRAIKGVELGLMGRAFYERSPVLHLPVSTIENFYDMQPEGPLHEYFYRLMVNLSDDLNQDHYEPAHAYAAPYTAQAIYDSELLGKKMNVWFYDEELLAADDGGINQMYRLSKLKGTLKGMTLTREMQTGEYPGETDTVFSQLYCEFMYNDEQGSRRTAELKLQDIIRSELLEPIIPPEHSVSDLTRLRNLARTAMRVADGELSVDLGAWEGRYIQIAPLGEVGVTSSVGLVEGGLEEINCSIIPPHTVIEGGVIGMGLQHITTLTGSTKQVPMLLLDVESTARGKITGTTVRYVPLGRRKYNSSFIGSRHAFN